MIGTGCYDLSFLSEYKYIYVCVYAVFATLWAVAPQASLSMGFPRQEYLSGLPFPSPADLPNSGIEPESTALPGGLFHPAVMGEGWDQGYTWTDECHLGALWSCSL